jgi:transcription elongation factor GreB
MSDTSHPITPAGYRRLREEYEALFGVERPKLLETIAWAAANGDRSENADYHYGRKRLREVDRRINFLSKRMASARVTDPAGQPARGRIWFGADAGAGRISWHSPLARAMRGAAVGDVRRVRLPAGEREYEVVAIRYPD